MKVWLCSDGSYSDYHVNAVYTDEAAAKRVSDAYGWNDPEAIELDPPVPPEVPAGLMHYRVCMEVSGELVGGQRHGGISHRGRGQYVRPGLHERAEVPERRSLAPARRVQFLHLGEGRRSRGKDRERAADHVARQPSCDSHTAIWGSLRWRRMGQEEPIIPLTRPTCSGDIAPLPREAS